LLYSFVAKVDEKKKVTIDKHARKLPGSKRMKWGFVIVKSKKGKGVVSSDIQVK